MKDLKFLIVDDLDFSRRTTLWELERLGFESFVTASSGEEALSKLLADDTINFLIIDWQMSIMSSLELVKEIRGNEKLSNLPILIIISRSRAEDILAALQAGVDAYLAQPFSLDVLRSRIEGLLVPAP